ncbi:MAG: LptF/LptG family permease, partial [Pseudomonadota bacterium]
SDLLRWEQTDLVARFGSMGDRLWHLARGQDKRRVSRNTPMKSISNETTFGEDTNDLDILDGHLWRMAEKVSDRAKAKGLAGRVVTLKLKRRDHSSLTRRVSLRDPAQLATYTAERAVLLSDVGNTRLVMFDGVAQFEVDGQPETLSILRFEQLGYDLAQFASEDGGRLRKPSEMFLPELLSMTEEEAERRFRPLGEFRAEAHEAISAPLYAVALPMLAVALVLSAGFRRQGFLGRVLGAVAVAVVLRVLGLAAKSVTAGEAALWPMLYAPPLLGIALAIWLLSSRGMAPRRQSATPALPEAAE